jgi:hypothetical protein
VATYGRFWVATEEAPEIIALLVNCYVPSRATECLEMLWSAAHGPHNAGGHITRSPWLASDPPFLGGGCLPLCCSAPLACGKLIRRSRTRFRDRPKTARLHPGSLFGIIPESRSRSPGIPTWRWKDRGSDTGGSAYSWRETDGMLNHKRPIMTTSSELFLAPGHSRGL